MFPSLDGYGGRLIRGFSLCYAAALTDAGTIYWYVGRAKTTLFYKPFRLFDQRGRRLGWLNSWAAHYTCTLHTTLHTRCERRLTSLRAASAADWLFAGSSGLSARPHNWPKTVGDNSSGTEGSLILQEIGDFCTRHVVCTAALRLRKAHIIKLEHQCISIDFPDHFD